MGLRKNNLAAVWKNGRSRMIIIMVVALFLLALVFSMVTARKAQQAALPTSLPAPPALKSTPGGISPSADYDSLQRAENERKAKEAARTGSTALPTLIGKPNEITSLPQKGQSAVAPQAAQSQVRPYTQQELGSYKTSRDAALQAIAGQVNDIRGSLAIAPHEVMSFGPSAVQPQAGQAAAPLAQSGAPTSQETPKMIVQAGTLGFGVLNTDINSDEPGPVMSTVVDGGPLDKAVLLGTMTRTNERVLVHLTTMRLPKGKTVSIDAYAVDQETARTALATGVDRHYFLRYGSMFASSFAAGFGQAYSQSGSSVVANSGGTTVTTQPNTSKQALAAGLSSVGQAWAGAVQQNFNTPPTVTVASGTAIGILFMRDAVQEPGEGAVTASPNSLTIPQPASATQIPPAAPVIPVAPARAGTPLGSSAVFYPPQGLGQPIPR